jgi:excisionase family DNA binding protein
MTDGVERVDVIVSIVALMEMLKMKLLTTIQVAKTLGLHRSRVHQLIKAGRLPAEKNGRDWFVTKEDLDNFKLLPPGRPKKED